MFDRSSRLGLVKNLRPAFLIRIIKIIRLLLKYPGVFRLFAASVAGRVAQFVGVVVEVSLNSCFYDQPRKYDFLVKVFAKCLIQDEIWVFDAHSLLILTTRI